jgi:hypothetical protein
MAMLVLLVLSTILAALIPVERDRLRGSSSSTTTTTETAQPTGELVRRTVRTDDATPERIELALGDQLDLTVESPKLADQVEIPAFGQFADVDPFFPARFDLLMLETGSFPVRLVEAGRVIARIDVSPDDRGTGGRQGSGSGEGRSNDSPGSSTATATAGASSLS